MSHAALCGFRKFADAHFWKQPTELWHFINQKSRYLYLDISAQLAWFTPRFTQTLIVNKWLLLSRKYCCLYWIGYLSEYA